MSICKHIASVSVISVFMFFKSSTIHPDIPNRAEYISFIGSNSLRSRSSCCKNGQLPLRISALGELHYKTFFQHFITYFKLHADRILSKCDHTPVWFSANLADHCQALTQWVQYMYLGLPSATTPFPILLEGGWPLGSRWPKTWEKFHRIRVIRLWRAWY